MSAKSDQDSKRRQHLARQCERAGQDASSFGLLSNSCSQCGEQANTAKFLAAEAAFFAADRAVQTLGGLSDENPGMARIPAINNQPGATVYYYVPID